MPSPFVFSAEKWSNTKARLRSTCPMLCSDELIWRKKDEANEDFRLEIRKMLQCLGW